MGSAQTRTPTATATTGSANVSTAARAAPIRVSPAMNTTPDNAPTVDAPAASSPTSDQLTVATPLTASAAIRAERGIRSSSGALITSAGQGIAEEIGVQPGDVIVQINRTRVSTAQEAAQALEYYGGRGVIRMVVERGGTYYSTDFVMR